MVWISSFSRTISPDIGYLAALADLLEELAQSKMLSGLTSSEFTERLAQAHRGAAQDLIELGFEPFCEPRAGMLWARSPAVAGAAELSYRAAGHDIMLGPGHLFSTDLAPGPWLRFNVAFLADGAVFSFLRGEGLPPC